MIQTAPLPELPTRLVCLGGTPYKRVTIKRPRGTYGEINIHCLVALSFLGPKPAVEYQVRHLDNDSLNNHFSNLKWGTPKENFDDRDIAGRFARGSASVQSKLSDSQVAIIRSRHAAGERIADIAKDFPHMLSNPIGRVARYQSYKKADPERQIPGVERQQG